MGLSRNLDRSLKKGNRKKFERQSKRGLCRNVPKRRGMRESHHHYKSSCKRQGSERESALNAHGRVMLATHVVINKSGGGGGVGHRLKGSKGLKGGEVRRTYAAEVVY